MKVNLEELETRLARCLNELSEYSDSVQILLTYQDEDGMTASVFKGRGNYFARLGMAQEFLSRDKAEVSAAQIVKQLNDKEDEE